MMRALSLLGRCSVAAVFIYAGATKAADPAAFATDISNYKLLPFWGAATLAAYLPWLEIIAGTAALIPKTKHAALMILAALSFIFFAAIASAWARDLDISCGCFGKSSGASNLLWSAGRALALFSSCVFLLRREQNDRASI